MKLPDLALIYNENLPSDLFDEFETAIAHDKLDLLVELKPNEGPMVCAEWFIPTAVVAFLASSYFGSALKEMGKDRYELL